MVVKVEIDPETGEQLFQLPDEIIKKFGLHSGDEVHFENIENGSIKLTFSKHK